jgi:4-hydroxy-3-methylbut-2-enyl diphosphate reductase
LGQSNENEKVLLVETIQDIEQLNINGDTSYTTQTTLSVDDTQDIVNKLKQKFPNIQAPKKDDICYATQNRQDAVKTIMQSAELLLVLGSSNSSNSNRLREIADKMGIEAYLIDTAEEINPDWLLGVKIVGVTAGASAPEVLVQEVINYLYDQGATEVIEGSGTQENVHFSVPEGLR